VFFSKVENVGRGEQWSLNEISLTSSEDRKILAPRKERINAFAVLAGGRTLIVNQEDAASKLNQLYRVDIASGEETRITNDLNSYFGLSVSSDGSSIVSAQRYFSKNIWVGDPADESSFRKITREPTAHLTAVWTSGGRIVYDSVDNNIPHIWISDLDGENEQQLTPNDSADYSPRVTPVADLIVFVSERTGEQQIWRMNIDGSNPALITQVEGHANDPRITPDGKHVLFRWTRNDSVTLGKVPIMGGEIVEQPLFTETYWALSNGGDQVAYAMRENPYAPPKVAIRRLAEPEPYLTLDIAPIHIFKWSDNDRSILYRQREGGEFPFATVWLWDLLSGSRKIFYSAHPDNIFDASISPDGKKIATLQGRLITDAVMLTKTK
jgi:Tol biopolymer transport system component